MLLLRYFTIEIDTITVGFDCLTKTALVELLFRPKPLVFGLHFSSTKEA
jgi:hypothetical protein